MRRHASCPTSASGFGDIETPGGIDLRKTPEGACCCKLPAAFDHAACSTTIECPMLHAGLWACTRRLTI